jgi:hypothetical protein
VGNLKNVKPKKDLRPPFFGSFFGRAKNEQNYRCITSPYAAAAASITASDIVGWG